jgi:hypothetical protein
MKKKVKKTISKINELLNEPIKTSDIYYYWLKKSIPLTVSVNSENNLNFELSINDAESIKSEVVIKKIRPTYVLQRRKTFEFHPKVNEYRQVAKITAPLINNIKQGLIRIKWNYSNFYSSTAVRNYNLNFFSILNYSNSKYTFNRISCIIKSIEKKHFNLSYKAKIFEEILEMSPYIKKKSIKSLCKIPIIKEPLIKSHFSFSDFEKFREALALQNDTKKTNVEITKIFDKLNLKIYQSIKPDNDGNKLLCYPLYQKPEEKKYRMYYFITGKRRDNEEAIKALIAHDFIK